MYSGEYDACDVTLSVNIHTGQAWKICLATVGIEPTTSGILAHRGQAYFSNLPGVDIHSE
jgi:hypothetical protein